MPKVGTQLPRCYQGPLNGVYTQQPSPLQRSDGRLSDVPLCSSPVGGGGAGGGSGPRGAGASLSPTTHSDRRCPKADGTCSPHGTAAPAAVSGSAGVAAAASQHHHNHHHHHH
eukprot:Rhum_TRINITY_DN4160_c0_g1::Rhum_TRINITY_DN4160_c0_g1_i1::g.13113::m.13113